MGGEPHLLTGLLMSLGDANKGSDPGDQSVLNEMEMYNTASTNGYLDEN